MKNTYDFVVIGGDFLGLLTALSLQKKGYSTCLIEESSQIGRGLRSPENTFELERGMPLFFATQATKTSFQLLKSLLGEEVSYEVREINPLIFEKGQPLFFKQDSLKQNHLTAPLTEFSFYTQSTRIFPKGSLHRWLLKALSIYSGSILFDCKVVDMEWKKKEMICCICDNGEKIIGKHFIFCMSLHNLELIFKNHLSLLPYQKSYKSKAWTTIWVDFVHSKKITDTPALHILLLPKTHKKQNQKAPFFGLFHQFQEDKQASQWLTFLSCSTAQEEKKYTEQALKDIKKHIQKIFPHSLDDLLFERLLIYQDYGYSNFYKGKEKNNAFLKIHNNCYIPIVNKNQNSYHHSLMEGLSALWMLKEEIPFKKS